MYSPTTHSAFAGDSKVRPWVMSSSSFRVPKKLSIAALSKQCNLSVNGRPAFPLKPRLVAWASRHDHLDRKAPENLGDEIDPISQ